MITVIGFDRFQTWVYYAFSLFRFADLFATLCHGAFLQHMQPFSLLHVMLKYSDTSQPILSAIRDRLHLFSITDLLLLCVMFDPSQDFTRHLAYQSQKLRYLPARGLQHSASMDSLNQLAAGWTAASVSDSTYSPVHTGFEFDLADGGDCQGEVHPQVYHEMFIESLLWLNQKRLQTQVSLDNQSGVCMQPCHSKIDNVQM